MATLSVGEKKNLLVFGVGDSEVDKRRWVTYYGNDYNIYAVSEECGIHEKEELFNQLFNCHKIDFNNFLWVLARRFTNNNIFFDKILFDWSTVKFIRWNRGNSLDFIYGMAKNGCEILIPFERRGNPVYVSGSGGVDYSALNKFVDDIADKENVLLLGEYNPLNVISYSGMVGDGKLDEYVRDVIDKHNVDLLKSVFGGDNILVAINMYKLYIK